MIILGISGKRESGKSSLAKSLERFGYLRVSLATPLKEECKKLYSLTDEQVYGKDKETPTNRQRTDGSFYTPRDILIREGMLKRAIDKNYWCLKLHDTMSSIKVQTGKDMFVIDDIRFQNEIDYFSKLGAKFVRIERSQDAIKKAAIDDLSETELDGYKGWDFKLEEIFNRNLADLDTFAAHIVEELIDARLH